MLPVKEAKVKDFAILFRLLFDHQKQKVYF